MKILDRHWFECDICGKEVEIDGQSTVWFYNALGYGKYIAGLDQLTKDTKKAFCSRSCMNSYIDHKIK